MSTLQPAAQILNKIAGHAAVSEVGVAAHPVLAVEFDIHKFQTLQFDDSPGGIISFIKNTVHSKTRHCAPCICCNLGSFRNAASRIYITKNSAPACHAICTDTFHHEWVRNSKVIQLTFRIR